MKQREALEIARKVILMGGTATIDLAGKCVEAIDEALAESGNGYTAVDMSTAAADGYRDGRASMRQELAEQGEPVAYMDLRKMTPSGMVYATGFRVSEKQSPVYTHPAPEAPAPSQQVEWQELSDEEAARIVFKHTGCHGGGYIVTPLELVDDIFAALRAKNGGAA
jgi:hypothetical protein